LPTNENLPLTAEEVARSLQSGNAVDISQTLVTLALYDPDWKKVEAYCLEFLEHPDPGIRGIAATCIGHLARIHQQLDLDLILPALYRHQSDPGKYVAGNVDNALSSIERFMQVPVKRDPAMRGDSEGEEIAIEEEEDEEEQPLTTEEVERAFGSGNILEIEKTLTALAFRNPDDWQRTEAYCLEFLEHPNDSVRSVAADCIRHLVSNYKVLDLDLVLPALYRHRSDPSQSVVKSVDLALRTIERILKIPVQRLGEAQDRDKK
jgi:hypothetical protein